MDRQPVLETSSTQSRSPMDCSSSNALQCISQKESEALVYVKRMTPLKLKTVEELPLHRTVWGSSSRFLVKEVLREIVVLNPGPAAPRNPHFYP